VLYNFTGGSDGGNPYAPPNSGRGRQPYTELARTGGAGYGTIYKPLALKEVQITTHQFVNTDGSTPTANLIQATDGNFYGTTQAGGVGGCNCGTVFKMASSGKLTAPLQF